MASSDSEDGAPTRKPARPAQKKARARVAASDVSSSSEAELDNWEILREMWPVEQRRAAFRQVGLTIENLDPNMLRISLIDYVKKCRKRERPT